MDASISPRIRGFSLIEVLVAVVVMSFGLLSLAALQGTLFKASAETRAQSVVLSMATEKLEYFEGYGDRAEFQAFTDGSEAAIEVDGIAYTRTWTVDRFAYPEPTALAPNPSFTLLASDVGTTPAGYVANNEFKRIQVKVQWTDASGISQEVALETAIAALSPQDTAKVAKVSSTGGPRGPEVIIVDPSTEEGVIPIAVGDGSDTAATNPKPEVAGTSNSQRVIETRFDVLTYSALAGGKAIAQSRVETIVAGCNCKLGTAVAGTRGKRPTYWNGLRYVVPEDAGFDAPAGVDPAVEVQSAQCTVCCRDHHDPAGVRGARFDPRNTGHATGHRLYDQATGRLLDLSESGNAYTEACRLIRVDGIFRVAADMYDDYMNLLETDNDPDTPLSDYVPTDLAVDNYQEFVLDYLDKKFVQGGESTYNNQIPPSDPSVLTIIGSDGVDNGNDIDEPHVPISIDRANDGTSTLRWLHNRGLYIDYLEDEALQAVNDAKTSCRGADGGAPTTEEKRTCVLKVLPFTTINLTELADWSTEDTVQIVASNNDFRTSLNSDVPVRGKVVPGTRPTHNAITDAIVAMRQSNSGVAVLKGPIDLDDAELLTDAQAFRPDAKWDCTTADCGGVADGGVFQILLESYQFTNVYPVFGITPAATCNPATSGNTRPNPFNCTSQQLGGSQSVEVGKYNYQILSQRNQDVTCTGASGDKVRKLKYTTKICRDYQVLSASHTGAGSAASDWTTSTATVTNPGTTSETTRITFPVVNPDDVLRIYFGNPVDTEQPYTCTYADDGGNSNDYSVTVPDCPSQ